MAGEGSKILKSHLGDNPVLNYCISHSTRLHPVQEKLRDETLKHSMAIMMGATEVIQLNSNMLRAMGAKKVVDIGVFTGVSALAAALAIPDDGKVVACDINDEDVKIGQPFWKEAGVDGKIDLRIQPAAKTLDDLIAAGEAGTFDFAFIDADKTGYRGYYEQCLVLLRKGGMIVIDNALWFGQVLDPAKTDEDTLALKKLNDELWQDPRVCVSLVNVGDGLSIVVKL